MNSDNFKRFKSCISCTGIVLAAAMGGSVWGYLQTGHVEVMMIPVAVVVLFGILAGCFYINVRKAGDEHFRDLRLAKQQAEAACQARGDFLARMSHEIRTPLNGIIGMTEIILATRLDDNQRHIMSIIDRESNHLLDLINDILDFSKIEAGKVVIESIAFDLQQVLNNVGQTVAVQADRKGLELNVFLSPEVPRKIFGDPTRLRQVLQNLVANAVKFTPQGEIRIKAEKRQQLEDSVTVRFSVEDTGIGIETENQDAIFDSFTQADASTTRKYGGTGLGTTISKSLVELMGGRIQLESRPAQGTCIWFDLSFGLPEKSGAPVRIPTALHVLMVDDCATSRKFAVKQLESLGCRARTAQGGFEALNLLSDSITRQDPFDLVITDFRMPNMSGYELTRQLRTMECYQQIPVIAISGLQELSSGDDFRSLGFDRCLPKPLDIDELRYAIQAVCNPVGPQAHGPVKGKSGSGAAAVSTARILLADDYLANQQVAAMHLASVGYQVDVAENGRIALDLYANNPYDLILMDIEMPVMDGYAATRAIRSMEQERHMAPVPIIAVTAHALKGNEEKCRKCGMNDFITKPLRRKKLLGRIGQWLEPRPKQPDMAQAEPADRTDEEFSKSSAAPMDWALALEEFLDQEAVLVNVLAEFRQTLCQQFTLMENALDANDSETVRKEAHAIKGGAANLAMGALSALAARLEEKAKAGDLSRAGVGLKALKDEFERLEQYLAGAPHHAKELSGEPDASVADGPLSTEDDGHPASDRAVSL